MRKANSDIAAFFRRMADLMEMRGDNPFKIRSYRIAAETIAELDVEVDAIAGREGVAALQQLPGVGKSIAGQILELVETGTTDHFERLRRETPETVADLMRVRGVGIKMATTLYRDFGVLDLDDLKRFAEGGGFEAITGLSDKMIAKLVPAVERAWADIPRVALAEARRAAEGLAAKLAALPGVASVEIAGELRRRTREVSRVDLLAIGHCDPRDVGAALEDVRVVAPDRVEAALRAGGLPVTVHLAPPESWPISLVRATGPAHHVRELEERAEEINLRLTGGALEAVGDGAPIDLHAEEDLYARLGLPFVPPPERF
jgi:DNA polymerase (family 10)